MQPFHDAAVAAVFDGYPDAPRQKLLALRELIFATAASLDGVGELQETLKWGEPAYLTARSKSGSTIRIAWKAGAPAQYTMYFNCQTSLIDTFRTVFGGHFRFEGNRAIVFDVAAEPATDALIFCIAAALTYHRSKPAALPSPIDQ
ncbi:hypothetical protein IGB42_01001 [Andreprevotia sp. IGB-42]|uniref:DUF1801 domain-containing protein n=1 Tax=Andreprevotia sp. IGB-42 TaxID=2497473 RepID=UPI00135B682E|nr:DUF1801 domain-containing protein [Andreprevotia sp. IGB-42]KAF0814104.1 hypothetical protein IGB42_01001 [Andreprevotia sp. IGB-42]